MKFFISVILVFVCFGNKAVAQVQLPPVYEITTDTAVKNIPDNYWQMIVDSNGTWTLQDVMQPPVSERFYANNTEKTGFGYSSIRHYWQRMRLKNSTGKSLQLVFENRPFVDEFVLTVIRSSGKTEQLINGGTIPWDKRTGFKNTFAEAVELAAGEEVTLYKKLYIKFSDPRKKLFIGYAAKEAYIQNNYIDSPWYKGDVRNWLTAGFLIFGFILNLFFFLIVREKVYLYLALLLLTEGLWYLVVEDNVTLRNYPLFKLHFSLFVTHLLCFFSVTQFVRHFLKTPLYFPRWDKVLIALYLAMATLTILLSVVFVNATPIEWKSIPRFINSTIFGCLMLSLLLSFLFFRKEKDRLTKLGMVAAIPLFFLWSAGYFSRQVYNFLNVRYNITVPDAMQWYFNNELVIEMFCVGWFAILFTWILLQQYALLRKKLIQQELEREKERSDLISRQKEELEREVEERTAELKHSLEELKSTQKQLIQSEKMASLGELTAGIAHEIQNPLNFVNNFSEVNKELIAEMKNEIDTGNYAAAKKVVTDIEDNEEKINFHGKRADAIVKSMLQHSRASSNKKEPTDINALADEYLRLAYHGLRAKDKSFNATMENNFDEHIGMINIVPQDIGRVLLNLFTNAFYSVTEKKKQQSEGYQPTVSVTTKRVNDKPGNFRVEIRVKDNGNGIPQKVLDKIFQPFFTTKPTGEGTGLGLSLSYDIIKAHGGELKVETKEGEETTFIIQL